MMITGSSLYARALLTRCTRFSLSLLLEDLTFTYTFMSTYVCLSRVYTRIQTRGNPLASSPYPTILLRRVETAAAPHRAALSGTPVNSTTRKLRVSSGREHSLAKATISSFRMTRYYKTPACDCPLYRVVQNQTRISLPPHLISSHLRINFQYQLTYQRVLLFCYLFT